MSDELITRVAALEEEVLKLQQFIKSLSVSSVDGNLVLQLSESKDAFISVGKVGNNVSVENSGTLTGLEISATRVRNNVEVNCEDGVCNVEITTGKVENSVISNTEN